MSWIHIQFHWPYYMMWNRNADLPTMYSTGGSIKDKHNDANTTCLTSQSVTSKCIKTDVYFLKDFHPVFHQLTVSNSLPRHDADPYGITLYLLHFPESDLRFTVPIACSWTPHSSIDQHDTNFTTRQAILLVDLLVTNSGLEGLFRSMRLQRQEMYVKE
jgi:hypothetical protein